MQRLFVANRGEIAVRICRTAAELGIETVAVAARDEPDAPHLSRATRSVMLPGEGPAAHLDLEAVVEAAVATGCDALHPGYGFASERPELAERCRRAGITFVGPSEATLARYGDKVADLDEAWERCRGEARTAFGDDRLCAEVHLAPARHVEVQVLGDGHDLRDRRRHRPGRHAAPADHHLRRRSPARAPRRQEAPLRRHLVSDGPARRTGRTAPNR